MGDGAGGELMHELLSLHIIPFLPQFPTEVPLRSFDDSAVVDDVVFTTDGHTVKPLFVPGGDIGSLSVCGTVNDISVMGATPLAMALSMILEEGLSVDDLERVMKSIDQYRAGEHPGGHGGHKVVESGAVEAWHATSPSAAAHGP